MRLCLFVSLFIVWTGFTQETIHLLPQSELQIQCPLAQITFTETSAETLHIQSELIENGKKITQGWGYKVQQEGAVVRVLCAPPISELEKPSKNRYSISLKGPSLPVQISLRFGSVHLVGLKKSSQVTLERGEVHLSQTAGDSKLNVLSGKVSVQDHTGRLNISAFSAKVDLEKVEGNVNLNHHAGAISLKNITGAVSLVSKKAQAQLSEIQGDVSLDVDSGKYNLDKISGSIGGNMDHANVQANLINPVRFRINGKSSRFRIQVPKTSGAQVYFALTDGQFKAPSYLSEDASGNMKYLKGALRGGESGRLTILGELGGVHLTVH